MVCNKTNANNIAALYGPDTEEWIGREIVLFETMVDFQGKSVPAVRCKPPLKKNPNITTGTKRSQADAEMNDEIGF
jgi:hypothetical protein